jgi:hypothetical protein
MSSRLSVPCVLALAVTSALCADPADDALAVAMKLSAASSYSWATHIERGGHASDIKGQTGGGGYSLLTFTGFSAPSSPGGAGTNAVFLGDDKYVIETGQGWVTPSTAPSLADESGSSSRNTTRGGSSGGGGMRNRGGGGARGVAGGGGARGRSGNNGNQDGASTANPRLPAGINLPHEELSIIVTNSTDLHLEGGVLSGKLLPSGADLLLVPPGVAQRAPAGAAGTFRLWIENGAVTKYELKLSADAAPGGGRTSGGFSETITVELSKVDATTFAVPAAARSKLSG